MAEIPLLGGAYQARSIIASNQRSINLFPEINDKSSQAPFPFTHYQTPGLTVLLASVIYGAVRCTYTSSKGKLYVVIGQNVYYIAQGWNATLLGTIASSGNPVSMRDNGDVIVLVDGSDIGYAIDIATMRFGIISDPSFYGADKVDYLDTFLIFNRPETRQFYISLSQCSYDMLTGAIGSLLAGSIITAGTLYTNGGYINVPLTGGSGSGATANIEVHGGSITSLIAVNAGSGYVVGDALSVNAATVGGTGSGFSYAVDQVGGYAFDPLDIAAKTGSPDDIDSLIVMHRELWLVGTKTTEIWYNSGAADFTFQALPGAFIEHGCIAKYSLVKQDLSVYWVAADQEGQRIIVRGTNYAALRISTHAIEYQLSKYDTVADCVAFTYQQDGHVFIQFNFPSVNKTWVYDQTTELWHERAWTDNDGNLNRNRANLGCAAYGKIVVGDWQNGTLYAYDLDAYTDNGQPISRIRSFPLFLNQGKRVSYDQLIADVECGNDTALIDGTDSANPPIIYLRYSDDRGKTWSNYIPQSVGATGEYGTCVQYQRLGYARYRVFELSWSAPTEIALNGAFVNNETAAT